MIGIGISDEICPEHGDEDVGLCQDMDSGNYWIECQIDGCWNQGEAFKFAHDAVLNWREVYYGEDHGLAGMGAWS